MRFGWGLLALLLLLGSQAAAQTVTPDTSSVQGQFYTTFVIGGGGPGLSQPTGLLISSAQLPALGTTDLGANAHLISDGWSADVTLHATTDASPTYAHYAGLYQPSYTTPLAGVLPTPTSNFMHFTDSRPGYVCTAGLGANCASTTFATTVYGTVPLRQPFGVGGSNTSQNSPITGTSGADLIVSLALSDPVFSGDTVGQATFASGFYNYDGAHPSPAAHVTPTTGTLPNYPFPIMSWVTPPGQYFSSAVGYTVEVNCVAGSYGSTQTSQPAMCAGVTVTASDGTHSVTRTALTMTASALLGEFYRHGDERQQLHHVDGLDGRLQRRRPGDCLRRARFPEGAEQDQFPGLPRHQHHGDVHDGRSGPARSPCSPPPTATATPLRRGRS